MVKNHMLRGLIFIVSGVFLFLYALGFMHKVGTVLLVILSLLIILKGIKKTGLLNRFMPGQ